MAAELEINKNINASYLNYQYNNEEEGGEEEEEETLSLSDLPLKNTDISKSNHFDDSSRHKRHSSASDSVDFFEFFCDFNSEMRPADDIIFCGRIVPLKDQFSQIPHKQDTIKQNPSGRRSDLQPGVESPIFRSSSVKSPAPKRKIMMRNSRSLDYRKLQSSSISPGPEIDKSFSARKSDWGNKNKASKPRWCLLLFGNVKVPPEMELSDIKNRQVRRNPSRTMNPAGENGGKQPVNRDSGKVTWRILRALSCKDHRSVAVTAPLVLTQASH